MFLSLWKLLNLYKNVFISYNRKIENVSVQNWGNIYLKTAQIRITRNNILSLFPSEPLELQHSLFTNLILYKIS